MDKELIHIIALKENEIHDLRKENKVLKREIVLLEAIRKSHVKTIEKLHAIVKDPLK